MATLLLSMMTLAADPVARRVCVLDGLETYSAPNRTARITRSTPALPSRLGAGTYVAATTETAGVFQKVRTLGGGELWVPETAPSGRPTLCVPVSLVMKVCGDSVPVFADFTRVSGSPIARLERGSSVQSWEYFEDQGRWTFVEDAGRLGFVRSQDLCHEASQPPGNLASEKFAMTSALAGPGCYQQYRTRAASEIRRIVIHNSEHTLRSAIATFRNCHPSRPTSAHVVIDRDGGMYRVVEDRFAAFHTGASHGGFNAVSLGIELVASGAAGMGGMTPPQERALVDLVRFWANQYKIDLPPHVLGNSTTAKGYADIEYWDAPVTVHRLVSAGRGTDCPKFVWDDSPAGDEAFFRWRRAALASLLAAGRQVNDN